MPDKTITDQQAQDVLDAFEDLGGSVANNPIKREYSGRAMYGKTCFGFVIDGSSSPMLLGMALQKALGEDNEEVATDLCRVARSDSMADDVIYYFPGWTIDGDDEEDDEDDADEDADEDKVGR